MTQLVAVEWLKLRTVRSTWVIGGIIVGLAVLITLLYVGTSDLAPTGDDAERDVLRDAAGSGLLA